MSTRHSAMRKPSADHDNGVYVFQAVAQRMEPGNWIAWATPLPQIIVGAAKRREAVERLQALISERLKIMQTSGEIGRIDFMAIQPVRRGHGEKEEIVEIQL